MSRSGYSDDCDDWWRHIMWRGAVESARRGKKGQALLKDMLVALDALPEKELIANHLSNYGQVCALGAVGRMRGIVMDGLDPDDSESVAHVFGIAPALAREIVYMNDEGRYRERPSERFARMRAWIESCINKEKPKGGDATSDR